MTMLAVLLTTVAPVSAMLDTASTHAWYTIVRHPGAEPCQMKTDDDSLCSYNGKNAGGVCACAPQWKGPHCASLNVVPTDRLAGLHGAQPDDPSKNETQQPEHSYWGGSTLFFGGQWHAWNAEITSSCGIWAWGSNSQIVYSTSDTATGTYRRQSVVFPAFAHEPTVARAPTGEFVMYFRTAPWGPTGQPPTSGYEPCDCSTLAGMKKCSWSKFGPEIDPPPRPIGPPAGGLPTFMSWAKTPAGPWSKPVGIPIRGLGDSNVAITIRKDGSAWGMGRIAMYSASNWRDNSMYKFVANTTGVVGEDPFVYIDETRSPNVFHMLRHCNTTEHTPSAHGQPFGQHLWSLDKGVNWHSYGDEHAYDHYANFSDGSSATYDLRERSHLIMDKDGVTPLALTNGACPVAAWNQRGMEAECTFKVGGDCREYSYNLLVALNQKSLKTDDLPVATVLHGDAKPKPKEEDTLACSTCTYCSTCPNNDTELFEMTGSEHMLNGNSSAELQLRHAALNVVSAVEQVYGAVRNNVAGKNGLHLSFQYHCCYNSTQIKRIGDALATVQWKPVPVRFKRIVCAASMFVVLADAASQGALFGIVAALEEASAAAGVQVHRYRAEQFAFHASLFARPAGSAVTAMLDCANGAVPDSGFASEPILVDSFQFAGRTFHATDN